MVQLDAAYAMMVKVNGEDKPDSTKAEVKTYMGDNYRAQGDYEAAIHKYCEGLDMYNVVYGKDSNQENISETLEGLGHTYKAMSDDKKGDEFLNKAAEMRRML